MQKVIIYAFLLLCGYILCAQEANQPQGHLVIIGGGTRPLPVMERFVQLAGGKEAKIAIITMASEDFLENGKDYEVEFRTLGAAMAKAFYLHNPDEANDLKVAAELNDYTGFYFGGGDQSRLTKIFLNTKSLQVFHERYRQGAVIGGTSAGAAIMSKIMITGDGDWTTMVKNSVKVTEGFGFLTSVIVDQHFVKRERFNRLLAVCLENNLPGLGIDESTALWVKQGDEVEVLGESVVLVVNPNQSVIAPDAKSGILGANGIRLDVLRPGDKIFLRKLSR